MNTLTGLVLSIPFVVAIAVPEATDNCILYLSRSDNGDYVGTCQGTCTNRTCLTKTEVDPNGQMVYSCFCREALQGGGWKDYEARVDCNAQLLIKKNADGSWSISAVCSKRNCANECTPGPQGPLAPGNLGGPACVCP